MKSERTKRTRTKRYINERREKLWEIDNFCKPEVLNFSQLFVGVEFYSIDEPFSGKTVILTNLSKFYAIVQFFSNFGQFFANSWLRNGNPVNWTLLRSKKRFIKMLNWFFKIFLELHQNWPKIFKIEQFSIMFPQFSLYHRFFLYPNQLYRFFFQIFGNSIKNFQNRCYFVLTMVADSPYQNFLQKIV